MVGEYKVITLCGSTSFKDEFIKTRNDLTLQGNIVISVWLFGHSGINETDPVGCKESPRYPDLLSGTSIFDDMRRILFVCHGNICRSPMAEFILKAPVKAKGMEDLYYIESAAVSDEEYDNPIYPLTMSYTGSGRDVEDSWYTGELTDVYVFT